MTLDAHAAYYYPHLKRDADKAHAILHSPECLCTQSLELMCQELKDAADALEQAIEALKSQRRSA